MKTKFTFLILAAYMLLFTTVYSQITNQTNTSTINTEYVGWDGSLLATPKDLDIENNYTNHNINFWTFNGMITNLQMCILGNTGTYNGYVGIHTINPIMPLHIYGDAGNRITSDGWP